ncbi:AAA family ATPase [Bradyrhizobium sp. SZCCHNR1015]|uniref:AAA family ATPase n=1 Tax=Bradyrhizobium sp. SZCCHNR1015 TaxID=3057338 RepID=UPI002916AB11|nr:AAA family ATPase [Bradyrhizobium sp. SZCCHNR1015]
MVINVLAPGRGSPAKLQTRFALKQDRWNDFGFQTLYHLYFQSEHGDPKPTLIGSVKILRERQTGADGIQISEPFESLGPQFCSVGTSLDYYARLSEITEQDRDGILDALRDVVANKQLQLNFRQEEGWRVSLFRDNDDIEGFLADATAIYAHRYTDLAKLDEAIQFYPAGWSDPINLDFDAADPYFYFGRKRSIGPSGRQVLLPRRIVVVIGRNGSGKSTLLARIARVAFAAPSDRKLRVLQDVGSFQPSSIGFPRIIAISYSGFDNFSVPAAYDTDLDQIASDIDRGAGRYVYAGLRDIAAEARDELSLLQERDKNLDRRVLLRGNERSDSTKLKSVEHLADEFVRLIAQIEAEDGLSLFDAALAPLLADASFSDLDGRSRYALLGDDPKASFMSWSTGHKIALHVIASIVATATRRALVLFDEPETHLHPPLVAALMHAIRIVLEEKNAFALVATHSPVVLQETLAQHVRIIHRAGDSFSVEQPKAETFGENAGILTQTIFGLTSAATDYHHVLDLLIENFDTVEQVNELFSPGLSAQALGYVMAGLARKERKE